MNSFDILNRRLNIHQNYLLEASAGTGKTFSIENLVVRLLIEENPHTKQLATLEQLLVVTFTRAAARDLKIRIRSALEKALYILQGGNFLSVPDYLQAMLEKGQETITQAKRSIQLALATFDQAQIFTIHGFCMRMLTQFVFESDFALQGSPEDTLFKKREQLQLLQDFFRTEVVPEIYSPTQLQILLNAHGSKIEDFQEELLRLINREADIETTPPFAEDLQSFNLIMQEIKRDLDLYPEKLKEDFENQKEQYKGIKNSDQTSAHAFFQLFAKNEWTTDDFDTLIREGLGLCELLASSNAKKKKSQIETEPLHYPKLIPTLKHMLLPLISRARSYECILARMVFYAKKFFEKQKIQEERYQEADLLKLMLHSLQNPHFVQKVHSLYQAAIIDEFQDTDPLQWEIFQKLFLSKTPLYLVGDPKQSIYAFRQADIYTYLAAAQSLGSEQRASLTTNYRSQPALVQGLNILFAATSQLFCLPAEGQFLDYPLVNAASKAQEFAFSDKRGCIHFFCARLTTKAHQNFPSTQHEEQFYFPYMAEQVLHLHQVDKLKFSQMAVLIKDKFQAQRLAHFFDQYKIPYSLQRQSLLTKSVAWDGLKELLLAVKYPKNENLVKIALGGPILGWDHQKIKEEAGHEKVISYFYSFKQKLTQEGFGRFFYDLMHMHWEDEELTICEKFLTQEKGENFYDELNQIANLLLEQAPAQGKSIEHLITCLDEFKKISIEEEPGLKKFSDPTRDSVSILTIHNSKGLEFDVVFAYGLVSRSKKKELLIPQRKGQTQSLVACLDTTSKDYIDYCEEIDAEKMRQLYVAMTRARYRLYVPLALDEGGKTLSFGSASPIDLFLARLGRTACSYQELYQRVAEEDGSMLQQMVMQHPQNIFSFSELNEAAFQLTPLQFEKSPLLVCPETVTIPGKQSFIQSFTSLTKLRGSSPEIAAEGIPHDFQIEHKDAHTLPAGNLIGKLLHQLLELFPFSMARTLTRPQDLHTWISSLLADSPFIQWKDVLSEILFQALNMQLGQETTQFSLAQISESRLYRETPFLYPCQKKAWVEEMQWQEGFLKGVIDLIFYHQDHYYLIDWKSNWLGPGLEHYSRDKMIGAMKQHDYYFQAHIYEEALRRYLKIVDKRPFEEIYGGSFYIFLRGLSRSSPGSGILKV